MRVDLALSNTGRNFTAPRIAVEDVQLYAKFSETKFRETPFPYPVTPMAVTGASSSRAREIAFQVRLPNIFLVWGELQGDRLLTYSFNSQIPRSATPIFYDIRGFGKVPYQITPTPRGFPTITFLKPCQQISIGDPFSFSVCNFKRDSTFHPTLDLITADLSILSADPTKNTVVTLSYAPISERGIVGAAYRDPPDCRPILTIGPNVSKSSRICVIIPKGEPNIKIIFTGDVNAVYDTGL